MSSELTPYPSIEMLPPDAFRSNSRNARVHSKKQIRQLADTIRATGFIGAIIIDENGVKATNPNKSKLAPKPRSKSTPAKKIKTANASGETKQAKVLALLHRPGRVSISDLVKTTGWQEHSVRGFLAGTVRKKLGLNLESKKQDGERIYRVTAAKPSAAPAKAA